MWKGVPRRVVDLNAELLEALNEHNNPQLENEEAQPLEMVPETVVDGSQEQEAEFLTLAKVFEAFEEDREAETSTRTSTLKSQSSSPSGSPEDIIASSSSFNSTGSIEDDHEVCRLSISTRGSGSIQRETSPRSPHWQRINTFLNFNSTSGVMISGNLPVNAGNIYKTTISNVGNNNSMNNYYR
jgi:hypothetical protein